LLIAVHASLRPDIDTAIHSGNLSTKYHLALEAGRTFVEVGREIKRVNSIELNVCSGAFLSFFAQLNFDIIAS
jgi:hypothetical protein